jgi:hypothetical protein
LCLPYFPGTSGEKLEVSERRARLKDGVSTVSLEQAAQSSHITAATRRSGLAQGTQVVPMWQSLARRWLFSLHGYGHAQGGLVETVDWARCQHRAAPEDEDLVGKFVGELEVLFD